MIRYVSSTIENRNSETERLLEPAEQLDDMNEMVEYKLRKINALVDMLESSLRGTSPKLRTVSFE